MSLGESLACINGLTVLLLAVSFVAGRWYQARTTKARERDRRIANRIQEQRDRKDPPWG